MAKGWGAGPYQRRGSSAGKRDHVAWVKKKKRSAQWTGRTFFCDAEKNKPPAMQVSFQTVFAFSIIKCV